MEKVVATREERDLMRKLSEDVANACNRNSELYAGVYEPSMILAMQLNVLAHAMAHVFVDLHGDTGEMPAFVESFLSSFHEEAERSTGV